MAETQKGIGENMKKYKTLIIFSAVFVVLVGLYFVMNYINEMQAEKEQTETIMMTEVSGVTSVEYSDGETTVSFVKEDDAWKLSDDAETDIVLDNDAVQTIVDSLSQIESVRVLEGAGELSEYGLDEPTYSIRLKTESGTEVKVYIGSTTGENYYATIGDKVVVYVIGSSAVDSLEFDVTILEAEEETIDETTESDTAEDSAETTEE